MKIIETMDLKEAIVPFETFNTLNGYDLAPEDALPKILYAISPENAIAQFKDLGVDCKTKNNLLQDSLYVFRYTYDNERLVPFRVTMAAKTAANYYKGSSKYGSLSIK